MLVNNCWLSKRFVLASVFSESQLKHIHTSSDSVSQPVEPALLQKAWLRGHISESAGSRKRKSDDVTLTVAATTRDCLRIDIELSTCTSCRLRLSLEKSLTAISFGTQMGHMEARSMCKGWTKVVYFELMGLNKRETESGSVCISETWGSGWVVSIFKKH